MKVSVIIATHNRAQVLRETLHAMRDLDRQELEVQWIVVDNNSRDESSEVIRFFSSEMPLDHLFESRPGKNCALNLALERCSLGDVLVFADDDVTPQKDWLKQIVANCDRWPMHAVFGGRIVVRWPIPNPPAWAAEPGIMDFGFSHHHLADEELVYPAHIRPYGPNMWLRRKVIDAGFRFDENIGPRPNNRIMGSETSFLLSLADAGYEAVYCPAAVVHHRIEASALSVESICRRAYRCGRGSAHTHARSQSRLLIPPRLVMGALRYVSTLGRTQNPKMVARRVHAISRFGWCIEKMRGD